MVERMKPFLLRWIVTTIAVFVAFILLGLSRLGAYLLKKVEDDENA